MALRSAAGTGKRGLTRRGCLWRNLETQIACSSAQVRTNVLEPRAAGPATRAPTTVGVRSTGTTQTMFWVDGANKKGRGDSCPRLGVLPRPLPSPTGAACRPLSASAVCSAELDHFDGQMRGDTVGWRKGGVKRFDPKRYQGWRGFATTATAVAGERSAAEEISEAKRIPTAGGKTASQDRQRQGGARNMTASNGAKGAKKRSGRGEGAWSLGDDAIASGSLEACNKVLRVCADRGQGKRAAGLIARMKGAGIEPSDKSYSSAINACGREGEWRRALALLREASSRGQPNHHHFSAAIKACATGQQPQQVLSLLTEMERVGLAPDTSCYNAALRAVASTHTRHQPQWKQAVSLLDRMEEKRVPADEMSYTYAIAACRASEQPEKALSLLRRISGNSDGGSDGGSEGDGGGDGDGDDDGDDGSKVGSGAMEKVTPNAFHYTAVVSAFVEREGGWRQALILLKEMQTLGVAPNAYTYNAVISACGKAGRYAQAVALLRQMSTVGIAPDQLTYVSAIKACGDGKQWPLAVALLREMSASTSGDLTPDVMAYTAAITACGDSGQWERALDLLREITSPTLPPVGADQHTTVEGLVPDEIAYNATISALGKGGQWRRALELLLEEMPRVGLSPSSASFEPAIVACAEAGEWKQAVALLNKIEARVGVEPLSASCYSAVIRACRVAGARETALALTERAEAVRGKGRRGRPASDKKLSKAVTGASAT